MYPGSTINRACLPLMPASPPFTWHPSKQADDKLFLDYGCYFFELLGNGSFRGYAVGFD